MRAIGIAAVRHEQIVINAAAHQVDWLAGAALEHLDDLLVGREYCPGDLVKPNEGIERPALNELRDAATSQGGREIQQLFQPGGGEFVQLGVPRCDERYAHNVSDKSAELPNIARAGYVDDVRFEREKAVGEQVPVSPQRKVVFLPPIDRK